MSLEALSHNKFNKLKIAGALALGATLWVMTGEGEVSAEETEPKREVCLEKEPKVATALPACRSGIIELARQLGELPNGMTPESFARVVGSINPQGQSVLVESGSTLSYDGQKIIYTPKGGVPQTLWECGRGPTQIEGTFIDTDECTRVCTPPQTIIATPEPVTPPAPKVTETPYWRQEDVPNRCPKGEGDCDKIINVFGQTLILDPNKLGIHNEFEKVIEKMQDKAIDGKPQVVNGGIFEEIKRMAREELVPKILNSPELATQFNNGQFVIMGVEYGSGKYIALCYNIKDNSLSLFDPGAPGGKTINDISVTDRTFWETLTIKLSDGTLVRVNDPVTPLVVGTDGILRAVETGQNNTPTVCPPPQK